MITIFCGRYRAGSSRASPRIGIRTSSFVKASVPSASETELEMVVRPIESTISPASSRPLALASTAMPPRSQKWTSLNTSPLAEPKPATTAAHAAMYAIRIAKCLG